jgi:hypothetical protein
MTIPAGEQPVTAGPTPVADSTRRRRHRLPFGLYPTLIAVVLLGEIYATYPVALESGLRPLLVIASTGLAITAAGTALLGRDRGAAAAALLVAALLTASTLVQWLLIVVAIGLILVERAWSRRGTMRLRIPWGKVTELMDVLLVVFLLLQVGRAVVLRAHVPWTLDMTGWEAPAGAGHPDIFVLLADGHGRRDVLSDGYGYDLSGLLPALQAGGFVESPHSVANEDYTGYSLPVLFNGRPLAELNPNPNWSGEGQFPGPGQSSALHLLRTSGYDVTFISPGFEHIGLRGPEDFIDVGPRNEVEQTLIRSTAIGSLIDGPTNGFLAATYERSHLETEALDALLAQPSGQPRFVYLHLPSPHWPVVFDARCDFRPGDRYSLGSVERKNRAGDATSVALVANQTRCVDALLSKTIGSVVAADPDAVVLVLSDHGPEERLDWAAPSEPGMGERMANLFWARTPGRTDVFPADVSLVNVLPRLFNAYMGTRIPYHPDQMFFGPSGDSPIPIPYP